jgi:hypothetical protein
LLAWLCKDEMITKLDTLIDEACGDDKGMTHSDREKAEAAVISELLAVERHEANLSWEARRQELSVAHGPDCEPKAILGVVLVVRPAMQPSRSSAHAFDIVGGR